MREFKYILNDANEPIPCEDVHVWGTWFERFENRKVARTEIGPWEISTIFLGLNHSFDNGIPLLFETLVSGPEQDTSVDTPVDLQELNGGDAVASWLHGGYIRRYATWTGAEDGHNEIVELLKTKVC